MSARHNYGSFDYKITHPIIRQVLDSRAELNNTIQVGMPFIKATTTIQHPEYLADGVGFTLGLHMIDQDVKYEDIFSGGEQGQYPLVGYTYTDGKSQKVYAKPPSTENSVVAQLYELFNQDFTVLETKNAAKIPPPGITRASIQRNNAGLLAAAQLEISVPTLTQLEFLHRVFFIPGLGMILEWGQQFSPSSQFGQTGLRSENIEQHMFPWYDPEERDALLDRLAKRQVGLQEILNCYTYPTRGQYTWMFGRIANFSIQSNADGSYAASVKIVGPSEDSFAYSTKTTVLPPRATSDDVICIGDVSSVYEYFTQTAPGTNLKTLLDSVMAKKTLPAWEPHVVKIENLNKKGGDPNKNTDEANVDTKFGELDDAYFMTWRFFVNVVLNHPEHGIRAIFKAAGLDDASLDNIALLHPYGQATTVDARISYIDEPGPIYIDDPLEQFVGYNQYLRSINPGTLVIVNEPAVKLAEQVFKKNRLEAEARQFFPELGSLDKNTLKFKSGNVGTFDESTKGVRVIDVTADGPRQLQPQQSIGAPVGFSRGLIPGPFESQVTSFQDIIKSTADTGRDPANQDKGLLSSGIWLNHRAIVESMAGADTILRGISNLLQRMSAATANYWQLALDTVEPPATDQCPSTGTQDRYTWTVTDLNYRPNAQRAVNTCLGNIHIFNKLSSDNGRTGARVGSDVIDCTVDLSLPKLLFSQIATMGLIRQEDLAQAGVELPAEVGGLQSNCSSVLISDPNETLRQMFGITSLSTVLRDGKSPDRTILPRQQLPRKTCTDVNLQSTAQTGGVGVGTGGASTTSLDNKTSDELKNIADRNEKLLNNKICKRCAQCEPPAVTPNSQRAQGVDIKGKFKERAECRKLSQMTVGEIRAVQKPSGPVLAVGKYQAIPGTFNDWLRATNIPLNTVFNIETQERLGDWLITGKRLILAKFLRGDSSVSIDDAHLDLAQEFASIPVPFDTKKTKRVRVPDPENPGEFTYVKELVEISAGESYYKDVGGNKASHTIESVRNALTQSRDTGDLTPLKQFIAKGEGGIDSLNRGTAGDTSTFSNLYYEALNTCNSTTPSIQSNTVTPPAQQSRCDDTIYSDIGFQNTDPSERFNITSTDAEFVRRGKAACERCARARTEQQQIKTIQARRAPVTNATQFAQREFPHLKDVFRYYEMFPELMQANIRCDANGDKSNAFGSSPASLSLRANLTLPGISGLRVGELFWVDRIPAFYKAFGAFQVISIEDVIDLGGWQTKINAYFNYLGRAWTSAVMAPRG